jgi:uncharacterized protein (DUF433 family)
MRMQYQHQRNGFLSYSWDTLKGHSEQKGKLLKTAYFIDSGKLCKLRVQCSCMDYKDYIESSADIMLGKPVVKGTRITVALILQKLSEGASLEDIIIAYPNLTRNSINAVLAWVKIKDKYPDVDDIDMDLPDWQKDLIDKRLKAIEDDPGSIKDIESLFEELDK